MFLKHGIAPSRAKHEGASGLRNFAMKKGNPMTHRFVVTATALGALASGFVFAQEAATPALEEIIVTAQKRSENLQDVPISVVAVSAQQIRDAGITNIRMDRT